MEDFEISKKFLGGKRNNYLPADVVCMATALLWAQRSKDPSTQVGACFVNENGRIISIGYNGAPLNWEDDDFPWGRDYDNGEENTKYPYVIHAEANGIMNYNGCAEDFKGSTVYVTLFPCHNCAKMLVQRKIKKVVYLSDKYLGTDDNKMAKLILKKCGVEVVAFESLNVNSYSKVILDLDINKKND